MKLSRRTGRPSALVRRDTRGQELGWTLGLVFNVLLLVLPLMAARVTVNAFAEQGFGDTPSAQAVSQTRLAIDRAFADMVALSGDPDQVWADAVDGRLQAGDLAGARGFLLAGPQMMSRERALALAEAAREEPSGSADDRLARAALIFLPDAVRLRYERAFMPAVPELIPDAPEGEAVAAEDGATVPDAAGTAEAAVPVPDAAPATEPQVQAPALPFSLVGDGEDLANRSARWLRGEPTDVLILRLRGFAQLANELIAGNTGEAAPFAAEHLALGVSVLTAAHRANRLREPFVRHIGLRVEGAIPEARLRATLEAQDSVEQPMVTRIETARAAYLSSMRPNGVRRLALEVERVARLAERTDPAAALELLSIVDSDEDLRRLNIVVDAGGERAVALLQVESVDLPGLATTGVSWTRDLYLQVMGLAALAMALVWSVLSALHQSVFSSGRSTYLA
jgi:hypothetical protein